MEDYYCLNVKFKDHKISKRIHHAHLFISDIEMYIQIIDNDLDSHVDDSFSISPNALGFFEENFEIIDTEISLMFDKSRIYKFVSFKSDTKNTYFTIYVSNICLILPNTHKQQVGEGKAILSKNGLNVVNSFYSFFTNFKDKNKFSISRMNGMSDCYNACKMTFRPELDFSYNEKKYSEEFTIKKIPTINFSFENLNYEEIKRNIEIICYFLSFCFGVRITFTKLIYRTEEEVFIYRNTEPNNKTYISEFSPIFRLLKTNYNIQSILKTNWFEEFMDSQVKIKKAVDNYLHSREVDLSASFLLLFNVIEIFNIKQKIDKFEFNSSKEENFIKAYELIKNSLLNLQEEKLLKNKWEGLINKISIKPLTSPLEETLSLNKINPLDFGYSFKRLKETRDKLTHGSVNSIKEEDLKSQIYCLRKIIISLILSNLGLKDDLINKA